MTNGAYLYVIIVSKVLYDYFFGILRDVLKLEY